MMAVSKQCQQAEKKKRIGTHDYTWQSKIALGGRQADYIQSPAYYA